MPRPPISVLVRALSLDASWHPQRMQGLGFLNALLPALRSSGDVGAALRRHAGYFNMNVWVSPVLLGALASLEMDGKGDEAASLRDRMAAPISGAGDTIVWAALRPAALGAALGGILAGHPVWALTLALAAYDVPLGLLAWRGFASGARAGSELGLEQVRLALRHAGRVRSVAAALAGGFAAWSAAQGWGHPPGMAFLVGGVLVVGYYAGKRQVSPGITFLLLILLGSVARHVHVPTPGWLP
jgi:mannose/fructose/N-acetylgalactosamine-specific phosphotransferase system component IID